MAEAASGCNRGAAGEADNQGAAAAEVDTEQLLDTGLLMKVNNYSFLSAPAQDPHYHRFQVHSNVA